MVCCYNVQTSEQLDMTLQGVQNNPLRWDFESPNPNEEDCPLHGRKPRQARKIDAHVIRDGELRSKYFFRHRYLS